MGLLRSASATDAAIQIKNLWIRNNYTDYLKLRNGK